MSARTRGLASLPSFSKMPRPLATRMEKATSSPRAPDAATAVAHARRSSASSALDFAMAPRAPPPHPGRAPARRRSEEGVGRGGRGDRLVVGRDGGVGSGGKVGGLTSQINFFVLRTVAAVTSCWVFLYIFYRRQTPARWEEKRGRVGGEERRGADERAVVGLDLAWLTWWDSPWNRKSGTPNMARVRFTRLNALSSQRTRRA